MTKFSARGYGWIPDLPDPRDYTVRQEEVAAVLLQLPELAAEELPEEVDLTTGDEDGAVFFGEVEDQGAVHSSTAFAVLDLVEYFERRIHGRTFEGSARFLYEVARNLRHQNTRHEWDTGVDLRTTFKALCRVGVPPEAYCPYHPNGSTDALDAFVYQLASARTDIQYFRLDCPSHCVHSERADTSWAQLVRFLSAGFPIAFGFSVPSSLTSHAEVHYRHGFDSIRGSQAAVAIGYRLHFFGRNHHAVRFRTSWGQAWGDNGLGWFSSHALNSLARDFWTVTSTQWAKSSELCRPTELPAGS